MMDPTKEGPTAACCLSGAVQKSYLGGLWASNGMASCAYKKHSVTNDCSRVAIPWDMRGACRCMSIVHAANRAAVPPQRLPLSRPLCLSCHAAAAPRPQSSRGGGARRACAHRHFKRAARQTPCLVAHAAGAGQGEVHEPRPRTPMHWLMVSSHPPAPSRARQPPAQTPGRCQRSAACRRCG